MTFGPTVLFVVVLGAVYAARGSASAWFLAAMAAGCFAGAGKLVIFAGAADGAPLGVWPLAALVVYAEVATAVFMIANLHHLDRLRWVGPHLRGAHEAALRVLQANPWMRRLMWSSVALFVAGPFQGTGAVLGTVLGRVLGLTNAAIVGANLAGTSVCAVLLALLGRLWRKRITWLVENPLVGVAVVAACLVVAVWFGRRLTGRDVPRDAGARG